MSIIIALLILIGGSTAAVFASDSAKPGDLLYPIDLAVENVQLAVATGEKKISLELENTEERIEEAKAVLSELPFPVNDQKADEVNNVENMKESMAVSTAIRELKHAKDVISDHAPEETVSALNNVLNRLAKFAGEDNVILDNAGIETDESGTKTNIEISGKAGDTNFDYSIKSTPDEGGKKTEARSVESTGDIDITETDDGVIIRTSDKDGIQINNKSEVSASGSASASIHSNTSVTSKSNVTIKNSNSKTSTDSSENSSESSVTVESNSN